MMKISKYLIFAIISGLSLFSCRKIEQLPPIPNIEFTSFTVFDTIDILGNTAKGGRLKFHFKDGDGDLGLNTPSANQTDTTNLFFTLFRKKDGILSEALPSDPLLPSSYRIPYMERTGVDKILKGTISVTFLYLFTYPGDTIKYDFYIKDRGDHSSNTASTTEIGLSENKTYTK
jgi:hypothetical protein